MIKLEMITPIARVSLLMTGPNSCNVGTGTKRVPAMATKCTVLTAAPKQSVPSSYIALLKQLYTSQLAYNVRTDKHSRSFNIERGTKQGDPLSPCLFNALLEDAMREVQAQWKKKGLGLQLGHTQNSILTNLRFADDVLLVATSLSQLKKML